MKYILIEFNKNKQNNLRTIKYNNQLEKEIYINIETDNQNSIISIYHRNIIVNKIPNSNIKIF